MKLLTNQLIRLAIYAYPAPWRTRHAGELEQVAAQCFLDGHGRVSLVTNLVINGLRVRINTRIRRHGLLAIIAFVAIVGTATWQAPKASLALYINTRETWIVMTQGHPSELMCQRGNHTFIVKSSLFLHARVLKCPNVAN